MKTLITLLLFISGSALGAEYSEFAAGLRARLGTIAYWKFDEVSGNFIDNVGGHTLTASGSGITYGQPSLAASDSGTSITVDGTGKGTLAAASAGAFNFEYTQQFSVAFSATPNFPSNDYNLLVGHQDGGAPYTGWAVYFRGNPGTPILEVDIAHTGGGVNEIVQDCPLTLANGTTFRGVVTYDGSGLASGVHMYRDGVRLQGCSPPTNNLGGLSTLATAEFWVGARSDGFGFHGSIDELAIFGTSLDAVDTNFILQDWLLSYSTIPQLTCTAATPVIIDNDDTDDPDNITSWNVLLLLAKRGCIDLIGVIETQS